MVDPAFAQGELTPELKDKLKVLLTELNIANYNALLRDNIPASSFSPIRVAS